MDIFSMMFCIAAIIGIAATAMNRSPRSKWHYQEMTREGSELEAVAGWSPSLAGNALCTKRSERQTSSGEIDEITESLLQYKAQIWSIEDAIRVVSLYWGIPEDVGFTKHATISEALYGRRLFAGPERHQSFGMIWRRRVK